MECFVGFSHISLLILCCPWQKFRNMTIFIFSLSLWRPSFPGTFAPFFCFICIIENTSHSQCVCVLCIYITHAHLLSIPYILWYHFVKSASNDTFRPTNNNQARCASNWKTMTSKKGTITTTTKLVIDAQKQNDKG